MWRSGPVRHFIQILQVRTNPEEGNTEVSTNTLLMGWSHWAWLVNPRSLGWTTQYWQGWLTLEAGPCQTVTDRHRRMDSPPSTEFMSEFWARLISPPQNPEERENALSVIAVSNEVESNPGFFSMPVLLPPLSHLISQPTDYFDLTFACRSV